MKRESVLCLLFFIPQAFVLFFLARCNNFLFPTFTQPKLALHIDDLIHNDSQLPLFIVRLFHNKISVAFFDILNYYLTYFSNTHVLSLTSLIGFLSLGYLFYYIWKRREKKLIFLITILLLIPFLGIFNVLGESTILKLLFLIFPYHIAGLLGFSFFIKSQKIKIVFPIVIILSIFSLTFLLIAPINQSLYCQ
jgi:hypothetical protein